MITQGTNTQLFIVKLSLEFPLLAIRKNAGLLQSTGRLTKENLKTETVAKAEERNKPTHQQSQTTFDKH